MEGFIGFVSVRLSGVTDCENCCEEGPLNCGSATLKRERFMGSCEEHVEALQNCRIFGASKAVKHEQCV